MNNLTTRKIVLGLLMTLVLAFGVQGTAEALTLRRPSNSGDLRTVVTDQPLTVRFSVSRQRVPAKDADGNSIYTFDGGASYYSLKSGDYYFLSSGLNHPRNPATVAEDSDPIGTRTTVYDYDEEQIQISVTGVLSNVEVNGVSYTQSDTTIVVYAENPAGTEVSFPSSSTITLTATAGAGAYTITVADQTETSDRPSGTLQATSISNTVYVVPGTSPTVMTLTGDGADGVEIGNDFGVHQIDGLFIRTPSFLLPIKLKVLDASSCNPVMVLGKPATLARLRHPVRHPYFLG